MAKQKKPVNVSRYYNPDSVIVESEQEFRLTPEQQLNLQRIVDYEIQSAKSCADVEFEPRKPPKKVAVCKFPVHLD